MASYINLRTNYFFFKYVLVLVITPEISKVLFSLNVLEAQHSALLIETLSMLAWLATITKAVVVIGVCR